MEDPRNLHAVSLSTPSASHSTLALLLRSSTLVETTFCPFHQAVAKASSRYDKLGDKGQCGRWGRRSCISPADARGWQGLFLPWCRCSPGPEMGPRGVRPWETRKQRIPTSSTALHTHLDARRASCSLSPSPPDKHPSSSPCLRVSRRWPYSAPLRDPHGRSCKPWRRLLPPPTIGLRSTGSGARRDLRARGSRAAQPFPPN